MIDPISAAALIAVAAWIYLLAWRGGFWLARPHLRFEAPAETRLTAYPAVTAVVPARNEGDVIATAIESLLGQDYPGDFRIVLVDDASDDGTAGIARDAAARLDAADRLAIIRSASLPPGWTGKMWAMAQGVREAAADRPVYLWLTDADIAHHPLELRRLAERAESDSLDLVSLMVRLRCESFWERLLIPAFVFFFQKLYPFTWVNDPQRRVAAAAGGSMLVRRTALAAVGSIGAIRSAVIDDCALARNIKKNGPIWLALTTETQSLRAYETLREIWAMVARTAYTQLRHSPLLLAASVIGLGIVFMAPPVAVAYGLVTGHEIDTGLGLAGWFMISLAYMPILRLYGISAAVAILLPFICLLYCAMTLDSARRHRRGRGGGWKGRNYSSPISAGSDGPVHDSLGDSA